MDKVNNPAMANKMKASISKISVSYYYLLLIFFYSKKLLAMI